VLINEHAVASHLTTSCKYWGPMWAHNCSAMESYYGDLKKSKSSSHHYQTQMLFLAGCTMAKKYLQTFISRGNDDPVGHLLEKLEVSVSKNIET
jgi:hypothetical protein